MYDVDKSLKNEIEAVADACFTHLVQHPEDLQRFMLEAGYTSESIVEAAGTHDLALGMIDYFVRSEPLLLTLSANAGFKPERITALWHRINRHD